MESTRGAADAVVIGGGPAGAAAARMLALLGRDVVLMAGGPRSRPPLGESLPPSTRKALGALGMLDAMEAEGFVENRGNLSAWAGEELRRAEFTGPSGFQVERARLDRLLLGCAREAGAQVRPRVRVLHTDLERDVPSVTWQSDRERGIVEAPWVLDCSGRAGVLARANGRVRAPGPSTIALVAIWRHRADSAPAGQPLTVVESYADGWAWSVPVDATRRFVATMVDPRATSLERGDGLAEMYAAELAKTRHLKEALRDAALARGPWGCTATPYAARRYGGTTHLLVGDAGSFLDPLSSFGVKKALASGWLAAIVVNTALADSGMLGPSLHLFESRERASESAYARLATRQYRLGMEYYGTRFWRERSGADASAVPNVPAELEDGASETDPLDGELPSAGALPPPGDVLPPAGASLAPSDPRLREALQRIRDASRPRFSAGDGARRVRHPTVRGTRIVLEDRFALPWEPSGIRHHRGVDLIGLAELAAGSEDVPALYAAYLRSGHSPVSLPTFLEALSVLVALELLRIGDG